MPKKTIFAIVLVIAASQFSILTISENSIVLGSAYAAGPCDPEISDCR